MSVGRGPLSGLRVVEFASVGPLAYGGMLLSDLGADVLRICRTGSGKEAARGAINRGRRFVELDLKNPRELATCRQLVSSADALIEGFRPGAMERMGISPEGAWEANPKLVFGRLSGWGQNGPLAEETGHDINFIALSGALSAIGTQDQPIPPLNLVSGMGGALFLAFGVVSALLHARITGRGQVVDTSMFESAVSLSSVVYMLHGAGLYHAQRGSNVADGGAPFYNVYRCADGKFVAFGAIEPHFFASFLSRAGVGDVQLPDQNDMARWPELKALLAGIFARRSRSEWIALMEGLDVCLTPVMELGEAPFHPHAEARNSFVRIKGEIQSAPFPRFSLTPGEIRGASEVNAADLLADPTNGWATGG